MKKNNKYLTISNIQDLAQSYMNDKKPLLYELLLLPFVNTLAKEIEEKTGKKYKHDGEYQRWSENPGSVDINGEKVRIKVPRMKDKDTGKVETPVSYKERSKKIEVTDDIIKAIIIE
jgi:hypothetical protein